jgi:hypothetical protein
MAAHVVRIGALVELDQPQGRERSAGEHGELALATRVFADTDDGRRIVVPDEDELWLSTFSIDAAAGPPEARCGEQRQVEALKRLVYGTVLRPRDGVQPDERWSAVSDALKRHGVLVSSAELDTAPFVVELDGRVRATLANSWH